MKTNLEKLKPLHYGACPKCGCAYNECECNDLRQETNLKVNDILGKK